MSRRFCYVIWCGFACLAINLSGSVRGADGIPAKAVGMAVSSPGRVAMTPQMMDGGHEDSGYVPEGIVESPM